MGYILLNLSYLINGLNSRYTVICLIQRSFNPIKNLISATIKDYSCCYPLLLKYRMPEEERNELELLFNKYQDILKNGIVDDAIKHGQLYFTLLHGEMTDEDKEQLQNDILLYAVKNKGE